VLTEAPVRPQTPESPRPPVSPQRKRVQGLLSLLAPSILFIAAMAAGAVIGTTAPGVTAVLSPLVDPLILILLTLLFIEVRFEGVRQLRRTPRLAALVLGVNFVVAPLVALGLSTVLVADDALRLGVLIYCLFPCTDWFLGFTRTAQGDTATGAAIIPVSLLLQIALFPVYIGMLAGESVNSTVAAAAGTMLTWFALPLGIALAIRLVMRFALPPGGREAVRTVAARMVPFAIAAVIVTLFAANVGTLAENTDLIPVVLLVVASFFVVMGLIGEGISKLLRLPHPERALLLVSTSARNAPLMLALTALTLPDQPLIVAAIVVGMLLEFPHLTVLTAYLRRSRQSRLASALVSVAPGVIEASNSSTSTENTPMRTSPMPTGTHSTPSTMMPPQE